jgi:hypothetical protein
MEDSQEENLGLKIIVYPLDMRGLSKDDKYDIFLKKFFELFSKHIDLMEQRKVITVLTDTQSGFDHDDMLFIQSEDVKEIYEIFKKRTNS